MSGWDAKSAAIFFPVEETNKVVSNLMARLAKSIWKNVFSITEDCETFAGNWWSLHLVIWWWFDWWGIWKVSWGVQFSSNMSASAPGHQLVMTFAQTNVSSFVFTLQVVLVDGDRIQLVWMPYYNCIRFCRASFVDVSLNEKGDLLVGFIKAIFPLELRSDNFTRGLMWHIRHLEQLQ